LTKAFNTITRKQIGSFGWTAGNDVAEFNGSIPRAIRAAGGRYWAPGYQDLTTGFVNEAHARFTERTIGFHGLLHFQSFFRVNKLMDLCCSVFFKMKIEKPPVFRII
jgi:hypothetical protein